MNISDKKNRQLIIKIAAVVLAAIFLGLLIQYLSNGKTMLSIAIPALIALGLAYAIWVRHSRDDGSTESYYVNKYHDVFFKGTIIFAVLLVLVSLIYSALIYLESGNIFSVVGLMIMVIWLAVFMIYFVWAVYFYNINYGITDAEWEDIANAKKEAEWLGVNVAFGTVTEPKNNPYKSQTFGLPYGTVRGMIALTLLFGGIALLVSSIGATDLPADVLALRKTQYEFFETAFLMMIAFYFGDRSLRYLRERRRENASIETQKDGKEGKAAKASSLPKDDLSWDDDDFMKTEQFRIEEEHEEKQNDKPITNLKSALLESEGLSSLPLENTSFVQIMDNINSKVLNDDIIMEQLEDLSMNQNIHLSLPVVKAIVTVESSGRGHLRDGKAKILFEGHKFWYWLSKSKNEEELLALSKQHPDILYKSWTRQYYKGGMGEYDRLERAMDIDKKAAIYSASWGLFQILGENVEHNIKKRFEDVNGYNKDIDLFVEKQHEHEEYHFLDFLEFILTKRFKGKPLVAYVSEDMDGNYDWAAFAHGYNGSGYKVNKYDEKLKAAYLKFQKQFRL